MDSMVCRKMYPKKCGYKVLTKNVVGIQSSLIINKRIFGSDFLSAQKIFQNLRPLYRNKTKTKKLYIKKYSTKNGFNHIQDYLQTH